MPIAATVRVQIESALARRIPAALSPAARLIRPVTASGIAAVDELIGGGVPLGAVTEMTGPECSGRTSLALAVLAQVTREGRAVAWVDACDALDPVSAAQAGVQLERLLWVRCGAERRLGPRAAPAQATPLTERFFAPPPVKKGLHGGGFGPHPRSEERGLSHAVQGLLAEDSPAVMEPRCAEPQRRVREERVEPAQVRVKPQSILRASRAGPLIRINQALRVTDLLLQVGGFGALVIDLGGIAPEYANRIPAATWFRYRAAAEKAQAAILLLTQHACAQSSAGLVLRMQSQQARADEPTVFTGVQNTADRVRQRFAVEENVVAMRKPPQRAGCAEWTSRPMWVGAR